LSILDDAGADADRADVNGRTFHRELLGEGDDGALGGGMRGDGGGFGAGMASHRGDVDDHAALLGEEAPSEAGDVEDKVDLVAHGVAPVFHRHLADGSEAGARGVVVDDVDTAVFGGGGFHPGAGLFGVAEVHRAGGGHFAARGADKGGGLVVRRAVDIAADHNCAACRELQRRHTPLAAAGAGDEHDVAVELIRCGHV
jgi:hypothetical protein